MEELMEEIGIPEGVREKELKALIRDKNRVEKRIEKRKGKNDSKSLIKVINLF